MNSLLYCLSPTNNFLKKINNIFTGIINRRIIQQDIFQSIHFKLTPLRVQSLIENGNNAGIISILNKKSGFSRAEIDFF